MSPSRRAFLKGTCLGGTGLVVSVAGCTSARDGTTEPPTQEPTESPAPTGTPTQTSTASPTGGGNTVLMVTEAGGSFFDPIGLFVEPGEAVTWEIRSDAHSATAYHEDHFMAVETRIPADAAGWDSETMRGVGETFTHTFETPGTYDYFCIPHKAYGMVGRIVVGQPGGPAAGSMPPDGEVPTGAAIVERGAIPYDEFSA